MHNSELAAILVSLLEDCIGTDLLTALQPPELSSPAHWERSRRHHSRIALSGISGHTASFLIHRTGQGTTGTAFVNHRSLYQLGQRTTVSRA